MKQEDLLFSGSELSQQGARLLVRNDGCAVWQFRNESGDGTMTVYDVFPGVMLSFNDVHMARYESAYVAGRPLLAIDHCREGRMEYAAGANAVAYTGAGDMKLDLRKQHTGVFRFPSSHYHGLTVAFDLDTARAALPSEMRDFPVTLEHIIGRWQLGGYPRVVRAAELLLGDAGAGIAEIGGRVGYDSASKFAAAFKKTMKLTPSEYRRERGGSR